MYYRDENYDYSSESEDEDELNTIAYSPQAMQLDIEDESPDVSEENFPSQRKTFRKYRHGNLQKDVDLFHNEKNTSILEGEKFLDCFRKNLNNTRHADKKGRNNFLHPQKKRDKEVPVGDFQFNERLFKQKSQRGTKICESEEESRKFRASEKDQRKYRVLEENLCDPRRHKVPPKVDESKNHSIFNSTIGKRSFCSQSVLERVYIDHV